MATSFSTNVGLSALPEIEQRKNPDIYAELVRIRNAIRVLQGALDAIPGFGGSSVVHTLGDLNAHQVVLGNGGGDIKTLGTEGTSTQVLTSNGPGVDPSWQVAGGGGLTPIASPSVLANVSGAPAVPISTTMSALIDAALGSTQGQIITRNASSWTVLSPGLGGLALLSQGAGQNLVYGIPNPPDPYFSKVTVLLRFETASPGFDESTSPGTWTVTGGVTQSSVQKKWGVSSALFNGSSGQMTQPASARTRFPNTSPSTDFAIEFWVYPNSNPGTAIFFDCRTTGTSLGGFAVYANSGFMNVFASNVSHPTSVPLVPFQWNYVRFYRNNSNANLELNGVNILNYADGNSYTDGQCSIGAEFSTGTSFVDGYIDSFRITNGTIGRYPAVPTTDWPTF